ncbi:hypothetical protein V7S43_018616 [Phytophthora oleae]|uniref:Uncharacterized protein n=1 Tax=Phytophthora oleae TaxID=2107226 RepID=A0ABD3EQQ4_9STRA
MNAFDTKPQRAREVSNLTGTINVLKCAAETHADDIETASALRKDMRSTDKLMLQRARKDLYVTERSTKERVYPEGMEPPSQWAYETPKNFRYNALHRFESNVKGAFSNKANGNINKFQIQFKSRKRDGRYFTF